ncbi:hypothetical protein ACH4D4_05025 [Streptomyces pristinaespiralis]|uniref:hypothetical protein n=1 Tax=Streptomyces pristinaespiralis TaxID=38300 RepID=UPI0037A3B8D5
MAGPGGREVGRIAIRVLPNTSNFATSLQSYLDRIERRAQVKVRAVADFTGFAADVRSQLSQVRARIEVPVTPNTRDFADRVRTELSRTSARVRVPVLPDTRRFATLLRQEIASSSVRLQVPVEPDTDRFAQRIESQLRGPLRQTRLLVGLLPDISQFRVRLERQLRAIRASLPVLVTPDFAGFRRSLRRELGDIDVELPVVLAVVDGEVARLRAELRAIRPPLAVPVNFDVNQNSVGQLRTSLRSLAGIGGRLAGVTLIVGGLAAAISSAAPAVAGLVASLAQIAPAALVGATAVLSVVTATAALKIGTQGVSEALKNAFDPESAEAFAEALKKLTPNAQKFVLAIQKLGPEFSKLRKAVQEKLFEGLDEQITATAKEALPVLRRGLERTAGSLNRMGQGVLSTARDLARSGTFGKAIDGANKGLSNLEKIPGRFVKGLTEIAAAAAPAFDRITKAADRASKRISEKITRGLESGGLEREIDKAIEKIKQLGRIGRNIGRTIGNIFRQAETSGADFLSVLERTTAQFAKMTSTEDAQKTFGAIFETLSVISETVGRLVGEAFKAIGPALQELAGPLQTVVRNLERGLAPIIRELGPIMRDLATNLGGVARELSPLLGPLGELVGLILRGLAPILKKAGEQAVILAGHLNRLLKPALEKLGPLVDPLVRVTGRLVAGFIDFQNKVLVKLTPLFDALGLAFGRILEALTPLAVEFEKLIDKILPKLKPILDPIIETMGELVVLFANGLTRVIEEFVIPAIEGLIALLEGDFDKAFTQAGIIAANAVRFIGDVLSKLPSIVGEILTRLALVLLQQISQAMTDFEFWVARGVDNAISQLAKSPGRAARALSSLGWEVSSMARAELSELVAAVNQKINEAVARVAALPSRAAGALRGARSYLYSAGVNLVLGLMDGILARASSVAAAAKGVVERAIAAAKGALGINSPSRVFREIGEQTGQGLVIGLDDMRHDVAKSMGSLVGVPTMKLSSMANLSTVPAGGASAAFTGNLYLESGELLGVVSGVMDQRDRQLVSTLRAGRKG